MFSKSFAWLYRTVAKLYVCVERSVSKLNRLNALNFKICFTFSRKFRNFSGKHVTYRQRETETKSEQSNTKHKYHDLSMINAVRWENTPDLFGLNVWTNALVPGARAAIVDLYNVNVFRHFRTVLKNDRSNQQWENVSSLPNLLNSI